MHLIVNIYHLNNPSSKLLFNQSLSTQKSIKAEEYPVYLPKTLTSCPYGRG